MPVLNRPRCAALKELITYAIGNTFLLDGASGALTVSPSQGDAQAPFKAPSTLLSRQRKTYEGIWCGCSTARNATKTTDTSASPSVTKRELQS